ncbi:RagB/SusD family nutrient uptake outer membrane protein [Arachidicoccus terrestris]|uniref:RagB/SusD family nutrient uptake outer membrane protein n=1 Tax=Arachidicoccus terrestris TaxID=2875539 RepID=UPI001CC4D774|nr:RagB/SusD family nutrient uptake outer membrane protein [Arachidicoccus terrestris]UAY55243.1 RagB/SusD family nutrient uptake outer membrane protein [Arachidicoccus terrestris]
MKKIILAMAVLAALQFVSCVKLDREPTDGYSTDKYFTNRQAAESNLASVYQLTKMSGFFEDGNTILLDDITDNAYCPFTNQLPYFIAQGTATPSLTGKYADVYRTYFSYEGIKNANYFLENIDKVPSMTDEEKTEMKAEVRFLRAFNYARKMMFFGGVPIVTKVLAYGEENEYPRNTEKEVTDFVLSELDTVAAELPVTREDADYGRATRGAALALKARVALFAGDYSTAEKAAKAVIDLGVYGLYNNYEGLFWEKNQTDPARNKEVILEVTYKAPTWASWIDALYTVAEGGWNSVNPTQSLVDAYETKNGKSITDDPAYNADKPYENRDPRFYASIIYPGEKWNGRIFNSLEPVGPDEYYNSSKGNRSRTGYCLRKYCAPLNDLPNGDPADGQGLSFIVFRYPEVLLTYAEALIEQNKDLSTAAAMLNQVRARVNMPPVTETSQAGLRKRLRNERRVEFAFEGLRWYDMKRWKIGAEVMNGPVYGVRPGKVNMTTGEVTFTSKNHITVGSERVFNADRDYYFPIPQEDLDASEALKGHQNPNW